MLKASDLKADDLRTDAFSWQAALLLASASKLAYEQSGTVEKKTMGSWGFARWEFIEAGDTQGFLAAASGVTMVAFRGTESLGDWLGNLDVAWADWGQNGSLHRGFLTAYGLVRERVRKFVVDQGSARLWITGHSLGGALASIAAAELSAVATVTGVCTFGQPRLADQKAAAFFASKLKDRVHRFVNNDDLVTRVPPGFKHIGRLIHFDSQGNIQQSNSEAEAETETLERPPLSQEQFERMQAEIKQLQAALATVESSRRQQILDTSIEGLLPSISDHRIDRYIAAVRRHVGKPTIESVPMTSRALGQQPADPTIELEGLESVPASMAAKSSIVPVLLRLRQSQWSAPTGLKITSQIGTVVSARATSEAIEALRLDESVASLEISRDAGKPELAIAVPFVGGDRIHRPPIGERGDSALIGIIDTGVDVLHEAFRDDTGQSRVIAVWDQRGTDGRSPKAVDPMHFPLLDYGTLYLAADIAQFIGGIVPPGALRDPGRHGSHVASIAAGKGLDVGNGVVADGMAPEARLVVVIPNMRTSPGDPPSLGYSASHADALSFLKQVAKGGTAVSALALPMAVNVSLGMNAGAHDGSSGLEAAFDQITSIGRDPGFVIVKSAGNEFGFNGHVRIKANPGLRTIAWATAAENPQEPPRQKDYIELWYDSLDDLEFQLVDPAGKRSLPITTDTNSFSDTMGDALCKIELTELHPDNGASRLSITLLRQNMQIMPGPWELRVTGRSIRSRDAFVDAWVERDAGRAVSFQNSDNTMTLSIPGTARTVITVAACNCAQPQLSLTSSSSFGPTRDGRSKPDVCAPGESIIGADAGSAHDTVSMTGTSMAAPMVTGVLALILSRRQKQPNLPQLNARQLQAALVRSTRNFTGVHDEGYGFGVLDAHKLFCSFE